MEDINTRDRADKELEQWDWGWASEYIDNGTMKGRERFKGPEGCGGCASIGCSSRTNCAYRVLHWHSLNIFDTQSDLFRDEWSLMTSFISHPLSTLGRKTRGSYRLVEKTGRLFQRIGRDQWCGYGTFKWSECTEAAEGCQIFSCHTIIQTNLIPVWSMNQSYWRPKCIGDTQTRLRITAESQNENVDCKKKNKLKIPQATRHVVACHLS